MKIAIALGVALFGTALLSGTAEARCWWDGYKTVCVHHDHHFDRDYYHRDHHFDRDYRRDHHFNREHHDLYNHDSLYRWR